MVKKVSVLVGAGSIGQAIIRRVSAGMHIVLADNRLENAEQAAKTLENAGFECSAIQFEFDVAAIEKNLSRIAGHPVPGNPFRPSGIRFFRAVGAVLKDWRTEKKGDHAKKGNERQRRCFALGTRRNGKTDDTAHPVDEE